jgi:hypothetical protein
MPSQERDEGPQEYNDEEWQTSHSRRMPNLWHQDVQNRKGLTFTLLSTDPEPFGPGLLGLRTWSEPQSNSSPTGLTAVGLCRKVDRLRVGQLLISRPFNEGSGSPYPLKVLA